MCAERRDALISFTLDLALTSKCRLRKEAAILVSEDLTQIYGIGVNGGPSSPRITRPELLECLCKFNETDRCISSVVNCLIKVNGIDDARKILICSRQPDAYEATVIVNFRHSLNEVWYVKPSADELGASILNCATINLVQYRQREHIVY